jgi:hypothetical protein
MRTAAWAALMVLGLGAMTTVLVWTHMQVADENVPVILTSPAARAPAPGWLHLSAGTQGQ